MQEIRNLEFSRKDFNACAKKHSYLRNSLKVDQLPMGALPRYEVLGTENFCYTINKEKEVIKKPIADDGIIDIPTFELSLNYNTMVSAEQIYKDYLRLEDKFAHKIFLDIIKKYGDEVPLLEYRLRLNEGVIPIRTDLSAVATALGVFAWCELGLLITSQEILFRDVLDEYL